MGCACSKNCFGCGCGSSGQDADARPIGGKTSKGGGSSVKVVPSTDKVEDMTALRSRHASVDRAIARSSASNHSLASKRNFKVASATPDDVVQELLNGNGRFILGETENPNQDFKRIQMISEKQTPMAAILACADSRVPIELVFDQGFGDLFVCRIAGNIATAEEIASLEYAVLELGVKVVMVMGHTSCGAVKAALSGSTFPGFIDILVDHLDVPVARAQAKNACNYEQLVGQCQAMTHDHGHPDQATLDRVIRENVLYQIDRCKRSTIILEALKAGNLSLVPALYDLETGEVQVLEV